MDSVGWPLCAERGPTQRHRHCARCTGFSTSTVSLFLPCFSVLPFFSFSSSPPLPPPPHLPFHLLVCPVAPLLSLASSLFSLLFPMFFSFVFPPFCFFLSPASLFVVFPFVFVARFSLVPLCVLVLFTCCPLCSVCFTCLFHGFPRYCSFLFSFSLFFLTIFSLFFFPFFCF